MVAPPGTASSRLPSLTPSPLASKARYFNFSENVFPKSQLNGYHLLKFNIRCYTLSKTGFSVCGSMQEARALGNWKYHNNMNYDLARNLLSCMTRSWTKYFQGWLRILRHHPGQAPRDRERSASSVGESPRPRDKKSGAEAWGQDPRLERTLDCCTRLRIFSPNLHCTFSFNLKLDLWYVVSLANVRRCLYVDYYCLSNHVSCLKYYICWNIFFSFDDLLQQSS